MNKIKILIRKEWTEVFRNKIVLFAVAFMPLVFTAIPLGLLYSVSAETGSDAFIFGELTAQYAEFCGDLLINECNQYIIITQFMPLFLIMPVIIPVTIASYSIVGEKSTRTLEPLLATPITTAELLAGKGLAAALPAILVSWGAFLVFTIGAFWMKIPRAVISEFYGPLWLIGIVILGPLLSLAAVSFSVMISSRTSDPRVAEQLSGLFVLPIVGLLIGQVSGFFILNESLILWITFVVLLMDAGLLYVATQLFQRETILTRWK